jgi:hypothetical protein
VVWVYLILQFTCFLITNGLSTFSNIIVKGLGFSTAQTQLLNLAQGGWSVMVFVGESAGPPCATYSTPQSHLDLPRRLGEPTSTWYRT